MFADYSQQLTIPTSASFNKWNNLLVGTWEFHLHCSEPMRINSIEMKSEVTKLKPSRNFDSIAMILALHNKWTTCWNCTARYVPSFNSANNLRMKMLSWTERRFWTFERHNCQVVILTGFETNQKLAYHVFPCGSQTFLSSTDRRCCKKRSKIWRSRKFYS